jgi:hypothetical protein
MCSIAVFLRICTGERMSKRNNLCRSIRIDMNPLVAGSQREGIRLAGCRNRCRCILTCNFGGVVRALLRNGNIGKGVLVYLAASCNRVFDGGIERRKRFLERIAVCNISALYRLIARQRQLNNLLGRNVSAAVQPNDYRPGASSPADTQRRPASTSPRHTGK